MAAVGTGKVRAAVLARDQGCLAPVLDPDAGPCADRWGGTSPDLTIDHVKQHLMMGKKAPTDLAHLVTLCYHHHLDGWATSHRDLEREYLRGTYPHAWGR